MIGKFSTIIFDLEILTKATPQVGAWQRQQPAEGAIEALRSIHGEVKIVVLSPFDTGQTDEIIDQVRMHRFVEASVPATHFEREATAFNAHLFCLRFLDAPADNTAAVVSTLGSAQAASAAKLTVIAVHKDHEAWPLTTKLLPRLADLRSALEELSGP